MWKIFQAEEKPEVQALRQERDGLIALVKDVTERYEDALFSVKSEFIKFAAQYKLDKLNKETTAESETDVIEFDQGGKGGSGSDHIERYRNDTARTDAGKPALPANYVHRIEWIAHATPWDSAKLSGSTGLPVKTQAQVEAMTYAAAYIYMYDDELWTPVVGGDAVEY